MFKLHKNMNEEIKKYQGRLYFFDKISKKIYPAEWIQSINDYNHYGYELHHVIPFTDWEKNTRNVQSLVNNALVLIPKVMHQHLENPIYKLNKEDFERIYGINPDAILYDINSKQKRTCEVFYSGKLYSGVYPSTPGFSFKTDFADFNLGLSEEDLSCFDGIDEDYSKIKGLGRENIFVDDCEVCCE